MQNENSLNFHIDEELDDEFEYRDSDLVASMKDNRSEITERLQAIKSDMETNVALENLATTFSNKKELTAEDINLYNEIVDKNNTSTVTGIIFKQVSLESFDTLINTSSTIANTASNITNKAFIAANAIKEGAVATAAFTKYLYEKVQQNIVKIASSWDFVCGLIEKRWLGLSQLVQVYELQHQKLYDKFYENIKARDQLAFFKVQLYVAKLRNDGRDISKKETLLKAIEQDSIDISYLGESFIKSMQQIKKVDTYATQAFSLKYPYKKALVENTNIANNLLKDLAHSPLFLTGGFVKDYQAQSRVLVGGKVVYINYNSEDMQEETPRKEYKKFISNMNFAAIKRRDGTSNDTENIEIASMTYSEAETIFASVRVTNDILKSYQESNVPSILKERKSISSLIQFATGLTGGNAAFDTIKRFFNNDDNLKAFNLVAPAAVAKLLGVFLGASSFAVFGGLVAASSAAFMIDYLRKYIISNLFSMMDLQYKITDIIERFDHDFIDTLIEIHNQGYRVCKKLASTRNWSN